MLTARFLSKHTSENIATWKAGSWHCGKKNISANLNFIFVSR
jgi:hypothetical protein